MTDFTPLQDDRTYLAEEVGDYIVYCCNADAWLDYYEQLFKDGMIDYVYGVLVEKGRILPEQGWCFLLPQAGTEDATFAPLEEIALDIISAAREHDRNLKQTCAAVPTPRNAVVLETSGYRFLPDWHSILLALEGSSQTSLNTGQPTAKYSNHGIDSVNIGEFKPKDDKDGKNRRDNEIQLVSAANHLLYNDPRRTSVSGMTIEGCVLRLWQCNRSRIAKSVDIDLTKNPRALIIYLLFSMTASKEKLGFDETIERIEVQDGVYFRIKLDGELYATAGPPLFGEAAFKLVGRATRVWRANKVLGDGTLGKECAIKDVWLFEGASREKEIQAGIYETLAEKGYDVEKDVKPHSLTILAEERIPTGSEPPFELVEGGRGFTHDTKPNQSSRQPVVHLRDTPTRRVLCRSVAAEVSTCVYDIKSFKSLFSCLIGIIGALKWLRLAGRVHRDVSAGNSFFYMDRGILGDLEYVKRYEDASVSDPKTGTPDFMATEYQQKSFHFVPPSPPDIDYSLGPERRFFVHYVHDIESVAWQYLWFLHSRIPVTLPGKLKALRLISKRTADYFSYGIDGCSERNSVIKEAKGTLNALFEMFQPLYGDAPLNPNIGPCPSPTGELLRPLWLFLQLRHEYTRLSNIPFKGRHHFSDEEYTLEIYERVLDCLLRARAGDGNVQGFIVERLNLRIEALEAEIRSSNSPDRDAHLHQGDQLTKQSGASGGSSGGKRLRSESNPAGVRSPKRANSGRREEEAVEAGSRASSSDDREVADRL